MSKVTFILLQLAIIVIAFIFFKIKKLNLGLFSFIVVLRLILTFLLSTVLYMMNILGGEDRKYIEGEDLQIALDSLIMGIFLFASNFILEYYLKTKKIPNKLVYRIIYLFIIIAIYVSFIFYFWLTNI